MQRRDFVAGAGMLTAAGAAAAVRSGGASQRDPLLTLPTDDRVRTGGSRMIDIGGGHHVWTKKVGDSPIKVLLLHGGPGADHAYFECFEDFLLPNGIEFYYYDQLDSTNSDKPGDPRLWTVERFRDEVEAVRAGLGLEWFFLYGHSWGGMLAIEYALAYPQHLRGLVISNMTASVRSAQQHLAQLRASLPQAVIAALDRYENAGEYESPEYQRLMFEQVYHRYLCRLEEWPEPLLRGFSGLNQKVYNYLQGPNEFVITGAFRNWDRWADLPRIHTPTLVMGARYDEMPPDDLRKMAEVLPNGRAWISDKGSHMSMYDDQIPHFRALLTFLKNT
jgi:proline iminopeptidase